MTSKFSIDNKELLQRISSGDAVVGIDFGNLIVRELAAFRLAAMDSSESVELPLDYLQGHKVGLEWAAQLAEANHPETGDWLYDDPIELAKAIRKGPDMPPAQPVADSEPVAYRWNYGGTTTWRLQDTKPTPGSNRIWPRVIEPLYRHAQTAPVVQCPFPCGWDNLNKLAIQDAELVARGLVEGELTTEAHRQAAISNNDRLLKVISSCRAAMLAAAPQLPGSDPATVPGKWIPVSERMPGPGILVLVYTPPQPGDYHGDVRIGFDYIDPDGDDPTYWFNHGENYEHFCCVACDGMTGPSEKALYTHWMPLPAAPKEVKP